MPIAKWGHSLAVRLPRPVVEALALKEGDTIEIEAAGARMLEIAKASAAQALLARPRKHRVRLPAGFRFDRLEAHHRN